MNRLTSLANEEKQISNDMVFLIAEDDDGYYRLLVKGLERYGFTNHMVRFLNGQEALDFFENQIESADGVNSDYLLILDIRMPKVDGIEVLKKINKSEKLKNIPVIMNSSTDDPKTVDMCYSLGCCHYAIKSYNSNNMPQLLDFIGSSLLNA